MLKNGTTEGRAMKAVFMMGGPASGKSTVRKAEFGGMAVIDADEIKESHPDYDPKNPQPLHAWSSLQASALVASMIAAGTDFVYDGTGSSAEKYVRLILDAQAAGFTCELVYVPCDLKTALARNAARPRTVPESVVREKYSTIATSFEIVARYADTVRVIG
jgi:predicted ABC-type ATPase